MIRTIAFAGILFFALVFIASLGGGAEDQRTLLVNDIGQLGLGLCIGVYLVAGLYERKRGGK